MKKKTLLSLIAACLFTLTLSSCFYDDPWYYGHHHGPGYYRPAPHHYHSSHHGRYYHGPNADASSTYMELEGM